MEWQMFLTFTRNYLFIFSCNFIWQDACSVGCCGTCVDVCVCVPLPLVQHMVQGTGAPWWSFPPRYAHRSLISFFLVHICLLAKAEPRPCLHPPTACRHPARSQPFVSAKCDLSLTVLTDGQVIKKPSSFLKRLDCWWLNQNVTASSCWKINNVRVQHDRPECQYHFFFFFFSFCVCGLMGGGCLQLCVLPQDVASETCFNLGGFLR